MRAHSTALDHVLADSHGRRLIVDVFHGPDRVMQGLELTDWDLEWDLTRDVKFSGSATVVYRSLAGESLVPNGTEGTLSPFRARLLLTMEITAGEFAELVTIGWARVVTVPSAQDYTADTADGPVVVSSVVEVEFLGLEEDVRRRGFRSPEQPPGLASTYAELQRVTGMSVAASVPDAALPAGITYDTSRGSRLDATQQLWGNLGCIGVIDQTGQWAGIPKAPGNPVGELRTGPDGTVLDVGYEVDTETVYNCVAGTFEDANRNPIYAVAEVTEGSLATDGLYGENTLQYSSNVPTTQAGANATVQTVLTESVGGQTYMVPVSCISNPVVEIGDVLTVTGWTRPITGRLIKARMTKKPLMDVTLEVRRGF